MTFRHKIFSIFTTAFAFLALSVFASAQQTAPGNDTQTDKTGKFERHHGMGRGEGRGMRGDKGGDKMMMRGLSRLNLTDAQKQQIHTLTESARVINEPLHNEIRGLIEKKRAGETLNETEQARLTEIKTQMKQSSEQIHNSVLGILTAEQRQQLDQMKQEMKQRREERRQMRQQNNPQTTDKTDTIN